MTYERRHTPTFTSINRRLAALDRETALAALAGDHIAAVRNSRRARRLIGRARRLARRIAA